MFTKFCHSACRVAESRFSINLSLFKHCAHYCSIVPRSLVVSSRLKSTAGWGTTKKHRQVKLLFSSKEMADPKTEQVLAPLRAKVKEQVVYPIINVISFTEDGFFIRETWFESSSRKMRRKLMSRKR